MAEALSGGRDKIFRDKELVYRPANEWTRDVHAFLKFLHKNNFNKVPYPYEINEEGQEVVSYVDGKVHNGLLPMEAKSDKALISFAKLLREFHDLGEGYISNLSGKEQWMLPVQTHIETMCHGDLGPYNVTFKGNQVTGLIDFDTLHPGSRLWDIAYALYRWVPLMADRNPENFGSLKDKEKRLDLFINSYGSELIAKDQVLDCVVRRLDYLVEFMKTEANKGDETFKKNIEEGHLEGYLIDIDYIKGLI